MSRACFAIGLGLGWLITLLLGYSAGGEPTLSWTSKVLYAAAGGAAALLALRLLASRAPISVSARSRPRDPVRD
jgi:hypothetical protein